MDNLKNIYNYKEPKDHPKYHHRDNNVIFGEFLVFSQCTYINSFGILSKLFNLCLNTYLND